MRRRLRIFQPAIVITGLLVLRVTTAAAQEMPVPTNTQITLLTSALGFDRNLAERVGEELVIGVLYQRRFRPSLNCKETWVGAGQNGRLRQVQSLPVRIVPIEVTADGVPEGALTEAGVDVLYIAPLRAVDLDLMLESNGVRGLMTMTGVPDYVEQGVALGIGLRSARPEILVNLSASDEAGADFDSRMLRLARIL